MLPTWIAHRIGDDCLSTLRMIDSKLADFQKVDLAKVDGSQVLHVELNKKSEAEALNEATVRWLNELPNSALRVNFKFDSFNSVDALNLARLLRPYTVEVKVDSNSADLSNLTGAEQIVITGDSLSVEQAQQLSRLKPLCLHLQTLPLSPDTIAALQPLAPTVQLNVMNLRLTAVELDALIKLDLQVIGLDAVRLVGDLKARATTESPPASVQHLRLFRTTATMKQCLDLAERSPCKTLIMGTMIMPLPQRGERYYFFFSLNKCKPLPASDLNSLGVLPPAGG